MADSYQHLSVLAKELIDFLAPSPGQNFIDCTLGGGGHSQQLLERNGPRGKVLAFELDKRAIDAARARLSEYQDRLIIVNKNYAHLESEAKKHGFSKNIFGIIFDLGLSSDQLDRAQRGFSFKDHGPLDMRFDPVGQTLTASDIILTWPEKELVKIFAEYGGEKKAKILARGIALWRDKQKQNQAIKTSMLVSVILRILKIPESSLKRFRIHPATKVFQALRIAVNNELDNLTQALPQALDILPVGGRLALISFHSLEDRIVKQFFRQMSKDCICPSSAPICVCDYKPRLKLINKKGIRPTAAEVKTNPRSRSAVLRVAEKI
ncbi:MAG: 16S rRNA (cytosine(1402)-N(4))-methyltransferase RsmH [Patescibacteria group bacterium]|nr:16S rRNA (cytosine(1402)-N(4))-methyltransferase RsmH [Patescibacteria group bacterium]